MIKRIVAAFGIVLAAAMLIGQVTGRMAQPSNQPVVTLPVPSGGPPVALPNATPAASTAAKASTGHPVAAGLAGALIGRMIPRFHFGRRGYYAWRRWRRYNRN